MPNLLELQPAPPARPEHPGQPASSPKPSHQIEAPHQPEAPPQPGALHQPEAPRQPQASRLKPEAPLQPELSHLQPERPSQPHPSHQPKASQLQSELCHPLQAPHQPKAPRQPEAPRRQAKPSIFPVPSLSIPPQTRNTLLILLLTLLPRLAVLLSTLRRPPAWFFTRGLEMGLLADSLVRGLGLSSPFLPASALPTGPTAIIAPGYPLFVAAIFRLLGSYSPDSLLALLLVHIALNLLTAGLILHLARRLAGERPALLAAALWACSPPLFWMPTIFWETSFSACLLLGFVALTLSLHAGSRLPLWLAAGALCALAGLLNPALLPSLLLLLAWRACLPASSSFLPTSTSFLPVWPSSLPAVGACAPASHGNDQAQAARPSAPLTSPLHLSPSQPSPPLMLPSRPLPGPCLTSPLDRSPSQPSPLLTLPNPLQPALPLPSPPPASPPLTLPSPPPARRPPAPRLTQPLLALLTFVLLFAPWPLRNARIFHAFIPTRTTVGLELWLGNHPGSTGFLDESLFPTFNPAELAAYRAQGELAYTHRKGAEARQYIQAHPARFVHLTLLRALRFWTGTGNRNGSVLFTLHALLTTLLGVFGLRALLRSPQPNLHPNPEPSPEPGTQPSPHPSLDPNLAPSRLRSLAPSLAPSRLSLAPAFLIPLAVFPLPYLLTHAEIRYHLVLDPLLLVLAAKALQCLLPTPLAPITTRYQPDTAP